MTNHGWHALLWSNKPTWTVMSPPPKPASSHCVRGWCSLVYGQPSYTGQVYQSHPLQHYLPRRWWKDDAIRAKWQGGHPTTYQKSFPGGKNGKLWLGLWTSTRASTEDGWRPQVRWFGCRPPEEHVRKAEGQHLYPLKLADSEPKEECYHSLNWVMAGQGQPKWRGELNGKAAPMLGWRINGLPLRHEMLLPTERYLHRLWRDGFIPFKATKQKWQPTQKDRAWGCALLEEKGCAYRPPKTNHSSDYQ